mgnify:FL=1
MAKTKIQMVEASLEDLRIRKLTDRLQGDYTNDISLGIKTETLDDCNIKGFLKTTVNCINMQTKNVDLEISVIYSGLFNTVEDMNEEEFQNWVEAQIVPQLISYTRSVISHITSLMVIPPIVLPTMDVIQSLQENEHLTNGE